MTTTAATAAMQALNPKQAKYVAEYVKTGNSEQSMIAAGYGRGYARGNCSKILAIPCIKAAISALMAPIHTSPQRCLEEMAAVGYSDIGDLLGFDGQHLSLKSFAQMAPEARRAISSIKARVVPSSDDKGHTVTEYEIKLHSKTAILPILARHHKLLDDDAQVSTGDTYNFNFLQPSEAREIIARRRGAKRPRMIDITSDSEVSDHATGRRKG